MSPQELKIIKRIKNSETARTHQDPAEEKYHERQWHYTDNGLESFLIRYSYHINL